MESNRTNVDDYNQINYLIIAKIEVCQLTQLPIEMRVNPLQTASSTLQRFKILWMKTKFGYGRLEFEVESLSQLTMMSRKTTDVRSSSGLPLKSRYLSLVSCWNRRGASSSSELSARLRIRKLYYIDLRVIGERHGEREKRSVNKFTSQKCARQ